MKTLIVLVSTYNGEKYLEEQMDSILNQDCERFEKAAFRILVRDDGSSDGTQAILERYAEQYPERLSWYQGDNIGVIRSFFELLQRAEEADYYAFADQDDYWMPGKLTRGIEMLQRMEQEGGRELPLLYCCRPRLVDEQLRNLESEIVRPPVRAAFTNALIENVATGCTEVFNRRLRDMVAERTPEFTVMHDWWLYLLATCFGKMYYDEESFIYYRQHGGNVLGTKTSRWDELKMRLKRFRSTRGNISRQAGELLRLYGREYADNPNIRIAKELVQVKSSFRARRRFLKKSGIFRQRKADNRIFHWILLSGSY